MSPLDGCLAKIWLHNAFFGRVWQIMTKKTGNESSFSLSCKQPYQFIPLQRKIYLFSIIYMRSVDVFSKLGETKSCPLKQNLRIRLNILNNFFPFAIIIPHFLQWTFNGYGKLEFYVHEVKYAFKGFEFWINLIRGPPSSYDSYCECEMLLIC